ncbi:MAG TPA: ATP-binding protein [Candidatus Eisenbacteria bacterium]|nr:ATP-binding protein [Candidatus Eisenbacteria bacterium]
MDARSDTPPAERPIPFWRSLQARIFLTFAVVVIGLVATAVGFILRSESESLQRETRKRGLAVARSIAWLSTPSLLSYNYVALNQAASRSQEGSEIAYVVIYDKEGMIAADSRNENAFGHPPRDAADYVAHAAREENWRFLAPTRPGEPRILEIFLPVYVQGYAVKWGTVRIGLSLENVDQEIAALTQHLVLAGILAAILCLLAARAAAGGITRPIQQLVRATRAVAKGDYSQRLNLRSGDELETLAWHFDHMAAEVQHQQAEVLASRENLARLNQTLEAAVEARTYALGESEAKYRVLVESAPQGILIVQGGRIVFTNPAIERMTGRAADELKAKEFAWAELFAPDAREAVRAAIDRPEAAGPPQPVELVHAGARLVHAEIQAAPLVFQNAPACMLLVSDVSAMRDLQERLVRGEKLRALGELAAGVAHDFNNILGIIIGRTQLLLMKTQDPEVVSGLNVVRQAAADGGEAVRRIQQFSRVREDREHEALDLPGIAEEVVEITRGKWKNEAQRRGVKVDVRIETASPLPILGSRAEIREALTNLIFNALDAMPRGGTIAIRCRAEGAESILEVADDGTGMSEEVRSRMFEPFYTTKGLGGTGLGLSMVYGIVSRHRGAVEVDTEPGRGTTIRMRFPATDQAGPALRSTVRVEAPFRARILVVDDERELLDVLRDALERAGHEIVTASSGSEGVARFREGRYDAVLTDLGMADVSGWEVARTVRKEGRPGTVLGLVTGWGATISEEMVTAHGVNFVVSKPFDLEDLVSRVNRAIHARGVTPNRAA